MRAIERFLRDLDAAWPSVEKRKVRLTMIGSAALMLQAPYERGTKDSDVLRTSEITPEVDQRLIRIAGKGSKLATRHRLYLEVVSSGVPFLPQRLNCHEMTELNAGLSNFEIEALDVVDVVVSKLKRFNASDRADIGRMVDLGLVPHARLLVRFRNALEYFAHDARASDLPKYVANLHQVERDMLGVAPTDIELPSWI